MSKLISTFKIGFDDETKAEIAALKSSLDAFSNGLKAGNIIPTGGLLAAMAGEAANDASEPELLQIGQWVFEGCDPKIQSASVDSDGEAVRWGCDKNELDLFEGQFVSPARVFAEVVKGKFDAKNWRNSAINRQPVNDVDYLSETDAVVKSVITDELRRNFSFRTGCLWESVPQITQADMQLIFIKNLSDVLIQRMHSMDRFSDDGRRVFCNEFKAWDIVVNKANDNPHYAVVCGFGVINSDGIAKKISLIKVTPWDSRDGHCQGGDWMIFGQKSSWRTVTEAELPAFRAELEACYV